jgi:hypothetical protein
VQFYKDDTFLTESVTCFIKEGLQVNDSVIIVATAPHCEELRKALSSEELANDQLMFLDAGEQLSQFMIGDWPSDLQFRSVIGGTIAQACEKGRVRIFGEMVAVLWAEGYTRAAIRLEELWNRLATEQSFSLLCAYPLPKFSGEEVKASQFAISRLHTHVHTQ